MTEVFKEETVVAQIGQLEGIAEKEPAVDFLSGPSMGQQFVLKEGECVFGRSPDSDVVIEDDAISRHHFKIIVKDKVATIEDLRSTNGTFVNGSRIKKHVLNVNDKIQISLATVLRFSYIDLIDKNTHERFYEMALYDPITMAYTKRYFLDRIQHEFSHSKRKNMPLSLIIIDLDFFKKVNDTHGHLAGDFILQKVSETTKTVIRQEDLFARIGGEEFAILMRDTQGDQATKMAERLCQKIAQTDYVFEEKKIPVTISAGVACLYQENYKSAEELIKNADAYLYFSKENGRNRVASENLLAT